MIAAALLLVPFALFARDSNSSQVFDAAGAGDHASHQQPRRFAEALTQPDVMAKIIDSHRQAMKIQLTTGLSEAEGCGELGVPAAA